MCSPPSAMARAYRRTGEAAAVQEAPQLPAPRRVLQLPQRLGLDLTDALAGYAELLADLFEGVVGVHADAEAHAQHTFLARRQRRQHAGGGLAQVRLDGRVDRQDRVLVLDEVAQVAVFLVADGGFEADGLLGDLQYLAHLLQRHGQLFGQLFRGRLAADRVQHLARGADDLVDRLDHVHRDTDGARLVSDRAGDRLTDPPGGVGRELVAAAVLKLIDGLHQSDVALLDQVQELQAAVGVFLGDGDHQAQVRLDHFLLGDAAFAFALLHRLDVAAEFGHRLARFLRQLLDLVAQHLDLVALVGDEIMPAKAGQAADAAGPVGVQLVAEILLE